MAQDVPTTGGDGAQLGPDAYKKLYPAEFYKKFIDNGLRPDGRSFGSGRPVTIGVGAIESANASALVKIGSTSVLAGLSFEIISASGDVMTKGEVETSIMLTALSLGSSDRRKALEASQVLTYLVEQAISKSGALDLSKLVSKSGKASLKATLDLHVLDADGAVLDACLLAAVATLASVTKVPHLAALDEDDKTSAKQSKLELQQIEGFCNRSLLPQYHTIGLYGEHLIVDPSSDETCLMDGQISLALDSHGSILGLDGSKPAFSPGITPMKLTDCIEAAKLRHQDVNELLDQALENA